ncbi:MAG: hypothetical protein KAJ52_04465, partial [Sedimentisphaerales bacterium]|nr:hypothetical protein [Sedimentisphaerales bacterium]
NTPVSPRKGCDNNSQSPERAKEGNLKKVWTVTLFIMVDAIVSVAIKGHYSHLVGFLPTGTKKN